MVADSTLVEIYIEFKWNAGDNPFVDLYDTTLNGKPVQSFLRDTKGAHDCLGQIAAYAAVQLGSQFRTHAYSVLIVRDEARIIRWDRSGAIVTEAISFNSSPLLAEFFRRYSKAPSDMRGIDQSVLRPTPEERVAALAALQLHESVPLVKLGIPSKGGNSHYFITGTPRAAFYTPPGRATRGFRAYDLSRKALCYLKDTWRICVPTIQEEGITYKTLMKANVHNIANCVAFGDILPTRYHKTKARSYAKRPWACPTEALLPHRHYRLVLDVVGRSLTSFTSSYEMVSAVRDAIIGRLVSQSWTTSADCLSVAHQEAYRAGVLHRDFSPGNIVIDSDGKGVLIDWDLSKPLSDELETPRRATRTVRARTVTHSR